MVSNDELRKGCAEILKNLRTKRGYSKAKMADTLFMDDKTWSRWEEGISAPTVPEFLWVFAQLGEDALRPVLDLVYPSVYKGTDADTSIERLRLAATHYFSTVATEQTVREWDYLVFGKHGSNIEPQMQEFTMIDHLPMEYRVAIASLVWTFWKLAEVRGELVGTDHIMPDMGIFEEGLIKGKEAAFKGLNSYTTIMK